MISIDYTLILVLINFGLLLFLLSKFLINPLRKFLGERENQIANDIDEAKASNQKARELVQEKEEDLKKSLDENKRMRDAAVREAESQAEKIVEKARMDERKIIKETEHALENERKKIMTEMEKELASMITSVSEKFLAEKFDSKTDGKLIESLLAERGKK